MPQAARSALEGAPAEIRLYLYAATCTDVTRSRHVLRFGSTDFDEVWKHGRQSISETYRYVSRYFWIHLDTVKLNRSCIGHHQNDGCLALNFNFTDV